MKISFDDTTSASPINSRIFCLFFATFLTGIGFGWGFQTEFPERKSGSSESRNILNELEAGETSDKNVPSSIFQLGQGNYREALAALTPATQVLFPWLKSYLENLVHVSTLFEQYESEHFVLLTPREDGFLNSYALESLEKTGDHLEKIFGHRPSQKVRVEIYPDKDSFSAASTLSLETLERSGAIGICKFHRLMILSPRSLPLGYRWLDALSHEYVHLMINELSGAKAELWFHEGTARYFETSSRLDPPVYLTPDQKTKLLEAREKGTLIPFDKMSPSLVYLNNQEEVSLAFSQVSYAIGKLIETFGLSRFVGFIKEMKTHPFTEAFKNSFQESPGEFEHQWQSWLALEKWPKTRGTLSDEIRFRGWDENDVIGADVQGKVRLGDQMRQKGFYQAALIEYLKAMDDEPDNAIILLKAARVDLLLNDIDSARSLLKRATEMNPNYGTPHIELAKLVDPGVALYQLEEANAINPFDPEIHLLWSDAWEMLGKKKKAQEEKEIYELLKN